MTKSEAQRYAKDPAAAQRDALKVLERHARDAKARKSRSRVLPGHPAAERANRDKKQAETREAEFYATAKREAERRATDSLGVRCEGTMDATGARCNRNADDPDHVLGGAYRKECEPLGAEGLMLLCRHHHDLKHASAPSRPYWLTLAAEHAERHGYGRLAALVAKARARYDAKHPEVKP